MRKIILLCAMGMSTQKIVNQLIQMAQSEGVEIEVESFPYGEASKTAVDADMILLSPQIRYNQDKIKRSFPSIPVEAIDIVAYGMMDTQKILGQIKTALGL